ALRFEGWRTIAQLAQGEDPASLGCDYILQGKAPVALEHAR
ncbi:MAG: ATP phosphoribosyltransferase regulatory subunit, partial [Porphyrobacter sp.]|nr:ATP phosphoribosyltransferase regulatory subunit [Porphyrobacter sp.]